MTCLDEPINPGDWKLSVEAEKALLHLFVVGDLHGYKEKKETPESSCIFAHEQETEIIF